METLVFATRNKGKVKEAKEILGDTFNLLSLDDLNIDIDVVEDGSSLVENALKKAKAIQPITSTLVLAEDSGLFIDYLNGGPGIYSARFMGEETPYKDKMNNILTQMQGVSKEHRTAKFVCTYVLLITYR